MRIIELENRCTGNRTVGSNPTLSDPTRCCIRDCGGFAKPRYTLRYTCAAARNQRLFPFGTSRKPSSSNSTPALRSASSTRSSKRIKIWRPTLWGQAPDTP